MDCRYRTYLYENWQSAIGAFRRHEGMTTVAGVLLALALAVLSLVGLDIRFKDDASLYIGALFGAWLLFLFISVTPYLLWRNQKKKIAILEEELIPKIEISDPQQYFMPWRPAQMGERVHRHFFITITNISSTTIKNCSVEEYAFTNVFGHTPPSQGRVFRLCSERAADPKEHPYTRKFDLRGKDDKKDVDICSMNEGLNDSLVHMYYATTKTEQQKDSIKRNVFPHILIIQVSADNISQPVRKSFKIYITDDGNFAMDTIEDA